MGRRSRCWCGDEGSGSPTLCRVHFAIQALDEVCGCGGDYVCLPHVFGPVVDQLAGAALDATLTLS
jgi:hypothetical protein